MTHCNLERKVPFQLQCLIHVILIRIIHSLKLLPLRPALYKFNFSVVGSRCTMSMQKVLCRICIFSIGALFRFLARDMESSICRILFSESCSWEETMDSRFSRLYGSPLMKVARYITALKLYISQIGASPVPYQVTNCSHSLSIFSKLWLTQRASPLPPAGLDRKHHSPEEYLRYNFLNWTTWLTNL